MITMAVALHGVADHRIPCSIGLNLSPDLGSLSGEAAAPRPPSPKNLLTER